MQLIYSALRKDLRLLLRDPFALLLWLGIPVIILTVMNLAFGGSASSAPKPRGTLFLADHDDTLVSGMVGSAFSRGPLGELFTIEKIPEAEGRTRMAKGDGSALIVVPKGFQDRLLRNEPVALQLVTNPSQRILPAIAGESLQMLSEAVHYLHLVAGDQIRQFADRSGAPTEAQVIASSVAINRTITELSRYIDPLLLDVDIRQQAPAPEKKQQPFNFAAFLFPGMLFMTVLFLARGASDTLWEELTRGTLRRYQATGSPITVFLLARLLAAIAVATVLATLGLLGARLALDLPIANWPAAVSFVLAGAAVWYLVMLNFHILAGVESRGEILTSFVIFPSMMIGGAMFPFAMMPDSIAAIGKATPLGWMTFRFDTILRGQASAADVALWLAILAAVTLLLFGFTGWHLRRKFLQG